jgi:hypothetical protein
MVLRKIDGEADARRCLAAVARAGGDLGAWTRAHGVDGRSLNLWRVNLARRSSLRVKSKALQPAALSMVELVPSPAAVTLDRRYVLEVAGARIELGDDFDEQTLRRVVRALRSC